MLESSEDIGEEVVRIFQNQFTENNDNANFDALNNIPLLISEVYREMMERGPKEEEIRDVVFDLNKDSTCGMNCFSGEFYQAY